MIEALGRWFSEQPGAETDEADGAFADHGVIRSKRRGYLDGSAELFAYLSRQSLAVRLTHFEFAAGELPFPSSRLLRPTAARKDLAFMLDDGCNDLDNTALAHYASESKLTGVSSGPVPRP